jgi:hypothetical protein
MRVALNAHYSSEGQRESSIDDQFRNCETRAIRIIQPTLNKAGTDNVHRKEG